MYFNLDLTYILFQKSAKNILVNRPEMYPSSCFLGTPEYYFSRNFEDTPTLIVIQALSLAKTRTVSRISNFFLCGCPD